MEWVVGILILGVVGWKLWDVKKKKANSTASGPGKSTGNINHK